MDIVLYGASHSLIRSITVDYLYFKSAALSDAYPEGMLNILLKKIFILLVIIVLMLI